MPERDYVTEPLKINFSGVVPFNTLYKTMRTWCSKEHGFILFEEKEHKTIKTSRGENVAFKWVGKKPVTDYITFVIEIDLAIKDMEEVKRKGSSEKLYKGDFAFVFSGYLLKDYEDTWSKYAILKFMREVQDKYIIGSKMQRYEKELLSEIQKLVAEVKAFLNVQKTA